METRRDSLLKSLDWLTIFMYVILVVCGWFSICGASYDHANPDFLDFSTRSGKQLIWIIFSVGISSIILILEDETYELFSYLIYLFLILFLIVTIFIAPDVKGSRSWLVLGPISVQPAEFAKFATALVLSKFISDNGFTVRNKTNILITLLLIFIPMGLIITQSETGSALVYFAFFLVLYREGMSGSILFVGFSMVLYFVIGIRFNDIYVADSVVSWGTFSVLSLIIIFTNILIYSYIDIPKQFTMIIVYSMAFIVLSYFLISYLPYLHIEYLLIGYISLLSFYLFFSSIRTQIKSYSFIAMFALLSVGFLYSSDYVFENILENHQQRRIKVVLGLEEDLAGAGYNVNQSKIAIGSGGLYGKGFLNGTQTKLKYVPEQDTDFIFCTVGEEQGFIGSSFVLILYLAFILRVMAIAERQTTTFGRVYGYSVMSIFLFHLFINIGMVLGLTPVIGIPLPFFSYGGSSLWGFTILLFILLRIDAGRKRHIS